MLKIKHVYAGYDQKDVLQDINIHFKPGKVSVLIGANGCGKSTLLKTIVHFLEMHKGEILFEEKSMSKWTPQEIAQKIAYLPQGKKAPEISVRRMVLHGRFPYLSYPRKYRKQDYDMVEKALDWLKIKDIAEEKVNTLSGGTQQKVYIAMALAQDTPIILMDEPTVYLDIAHQMKLMDIAKERAKQGKAVVLVLHDLSQALRYGDEIFVMENGKVIASGNADTIFNSKIIDATFHVKLCRVKTNTGWQYYYE